MWCVFLYVVCHIYIFHDLALKATAMLSCGISGFSSYNKSCPLNIELYIWLWFFRQFVLQLCYLTGIMWVFAFIWIKQVFQKYVFSLWQIWRGREKLFGLCLFLCQCHISSGFAWQVMQHFWKLQYSPSLLHPLMQHELAAYSVQIWISLL